MAWRAKAIASAVSGPRNSTSTSIVSVKAEIEARPRNHFVRRACHGLQQEADEHRPGERAEERLQDLVQQHGDDGDAADREHALVETPSAVMACSCNRRSQALRLVGKLRGSACAAAWMPRSLPA